MLTNQNENLEIKSGLIQFRAFCMQPFKGLQCILAGIHTSTCLPEQISSLRSKRFHTSSLRKLGREQKKRLLSWRAVNIQMNRTVKYQGEFSWILGFAGKRFLFSPPLPPSIFFCSRSNFRAITRLEMLATQANKPQEFLTISWYHVCPRGTCDYRRVIWTTFLAWEVRTRAQLFKRWITQFIFLRLILIWTG